MLHSEGVEECSFASSTIEGGAAMRVPGFERDVEEGTFGVMAGVEAGEDEQGRGLEIGLDMMGDHHMPDAACGSAAIEADATEQVARKRAARGCCQALVQSAGEGLRRLGSVERAPFA